MSVQKATESSQYLTFNLGEEIFAVEVARVREILDEITVTKVPRTPGFMRGVINLRGSVVPVIDLRLKFGMTETEHTIHTCIIVVEVKVDGETAVLGALCDSVEEVVELEPGQIEAPPRIGSRLRVEFLKGMGRRDSKFVMILDIDEVFDQEELEMTQKVGMETQ